MIGNWKPNNLNEALDDAIGSALSNNTKCIDYGGGNCSDEFLPVGRFNDVVKQTIKNIKNIKGLEIKYKEE